MKNLHLPWTVAVTALTLVAPAGGQRSGPQGNLPLPPQQLLHRLQYDDFDIISAKAQGAASWAPRNWDCCFATMESRST